jgi:hypothetical protein
MPAMTAKRRRIILIGYNVASGSLKNLQQQIKELRPNNTVLRIKRDSNKFVARPRDVIINWGPCLPSPYVDQQQEAAKLIANNKLKTFEKLKEHYVPHPEWTTDADVAAQWVDVGLVVVARDLLSSHSGNGIRLLGGDSYTHVVTHAPLFVKYKKKKHEYRVHVFNGKVIDVTQKKRKAGFENRDNQIRNHQNGWVYCREDITLPIGIDTLALSACTAVGLNSGAVDIIYNELENQCYVLEINTAPGVEGTTCLKYAEEIVKDVML